MKILAGILDHAVLQRTKRNFSDAPFSGECANPGKVRARVKYKGQVLKGFDWADVGRASGRQFSGRLSGLPAGGPYDIELEIEDTSERMMICDVLVGDVWVLGGQSNMEGIGLLEGAERPDPFVRAFYMHDVWGIAKDPLHNLRDAVDPVHGKVARPAWVGVGPGVSFGKEMRRLTGVPQGLIPCAHGGTSMAQWDPRLKKLSGGSLYGAMIRRLKRCGGRASGIAWYQGESDANAQAAPVYLDRMKAFIRAVRRDFGDLRLPFVLVQIGRVHGRGDADPQYWNLVQQMQRLLQEEVLRCAVVPAIDLTMDDQIHIGSEGQQRLGRRIAQAMFQFQAGRPAGKPPIQFKSARLQKDPVSGVTTIVVRYANVMGRLRSDGRPNGFDLGEHGPRGYVHDVRLDGDRAVLYTALNLERARRLSLYYGGGFAPYCNVTDSADRSLPVMGPIHLGKPAACTRFVRLVRVSCLQPGAGRLEDLRYPTDLEALGLRTRIFEEDFWDVHLELGSRAPEDLLVYFAFTFECAEPMRLKALIGYDGPVKVWIDRREVFHDPNGTNPAVPDAREIPFSARAGSHDALVALGSNKGNAWGVFFRFQRTDLPLRLVNLGPAACRLPIIGG